MAREAAASRGRAVLALVLALVRRLITARIDGQPGELRVQTVVDARLAPGLGTRTPDQAVVVVIRARLRHEPDALGAMAVDRAVRLFLVAHLGDGVDLAGVDAQVAGLLVLVDQDAEAAVLTGLPVAGDRSVQLLRAPRGQAQLAEPLRVRGRVEGLLGDQSDGLVVAVPVGRDARPAADDDERLHRPDRADDLADDGVAAPAAQRVLPALGEPEVVEGPVEDVAAVETPRVEALPRAHDPERLRALGPPPVLPALAARGRPVDGAGGVPPGHVGDQTAVLVVGVRAEVQHRTGVPERPDAVVLPRGLLGKRPRRRDGPWDRRAVPARSSEGTWAALRGRTAGIAGRWRGLPSVAARAEWAHPPPEAGRTLLGAGTARQ